MNKTSIRHSKLFSEMLWPEADSTAWFFYNLPHEMLEGDWVHPAELPLHIMDYVKSRKLVIQAGGNSGLYAKIYSDHFEKVLTFEPDNTWFKCLVFNADAENVFKFQTALGNCNAQVSLKMNLEIPGGENNLGALKVAGEGLIPQITIDSLNVDPDLIHLDIEGYEGFALEGAVDTIRRSSPAIVVETNESGNEYGYSKEKVNDLLLCLGYKLVKSWGHDALYERN